jgi:Cu-Zn family superoxide dismutase
MNESTTDTSTGQGWSRRRKIGWATVGAAALVGSLSLAVASAPASGAGWEATAVLRDVSGNKVGKIKFDGDDHGTEVKVSLHGITAGLDGYHGFHLHDGAAACDPAATAGPFTNVGGHWNPTGAVHGSHKGDLPTVLVSSDGTASARSVTGRFQPGDLDGRAVILHAGPDNDANIPALRYQSNEQPAVPPGADTATKATGDAGGRIACGIVELG